jgi:phage terminase large subunit
MPSSGTLKIPTSRLFEALRQRHEKIVVLEGSSRSTKTYSICQRLIELALQNERGRKPQRMRFLIMRQRLTWCRNTVFEDFKNILTDQFRLWRDEDFNSHHMSYRMGRSTFEFKGLDYEAGQKYHGAKYHYAWFNEALELDYASVRQILLRLIKQAFFDYNPNFTERHWIETRIKSRDDVAILHSTYKDNPYLDEAVIAEIERLEPTPSNVAQGTADETAWKIYGLGVRAEIKGLVFPNVAIVSGMPKDPEEIAYGMDFGFAADPTALIHGARKGGGLYLDELLYERGLTNVENPKYPEQPSIELRLRELKVPPDIAIWADSAEPKSITEIKNSGWNIYGVKKGQIIDGIMSMRRFRIYITERSLNLIDEFRRYKWKEMRDGSTVNVPVAGKDHGIDAARYLTIGELGEPVRTGAGTLESWKMKTMPKELASI